MSVEVRRLTKNLFLSKWGSSRYRQWGNILSKLANSVTCKSVLSSEKFKKKSENDPFYFSNSTSTVCRLLWNLDYWFLQGKDNQRIWDVGRHETLATPHIRLAMKNKHRISRYCINLRRVLIIAGCNSLDNAYCTYLITVSLAKRQAAVVWTQLLVTSVPCPPV